MFPCTCEDAGNAFLSFFPFHQCFTFRLWFTVRIDSSGCKETKQELHAERKNTYAPKQSFQIHHLQYKKTFFEKNKYLWSYDEIRNLSHTIQSYSGNQTRHYINDEGGTYSNNMIERKFKGDSSLCSVHVIWFLTEEDYHLESLLMNNNEGWWWLHVCKCVLCGHAFRVNGGNWTALLLSSRGAHLDQQFCSKNKPI